MKASIGQQVKRALDTDASARRLTTAIISGSQGSAPIRVQTADGRVLTLKKISLKHK